MITSRLTAQRHFLSKIPTNQRRIKLPGFLEDWRAFITTILLATIGRGKGSECRKSQLHKQEENGSHWNCPNKNTKGSLAVLCRSNPPPRAERVLDSAPPTFTREKSEDTDFTIHPYWTWIICGDKLYGKQTERFLTCFYKYKPPNLLWKLYVLAAWNDSYPALKLLDTFPQGLLHEH